MCSSDLCFPAKLSHGHIKALTQMHLDAIFYPLSLIHISVERCLCQIAGGVFLFDIDKLKHWPAFPAAERGSVCWPIPPDICGRSGKHSICLILSEEYEQFMS